MFFEGDVVEFNLNKHCVGVSMSNLITIGARRMYHNKQNIKNITFEEGKNRGCRTK